MRAPTHGPVSGHGKSKHREKWGGKRGYKSEREVEGKKDKVRKTEGIKVKEMRVKVIKMRMK